MTYFYTYVVWTATDIFIYYVSGDSISLILGHFLTHFCSTSFQVTFNGKYLLSFWVPVMQYFNF